MPHRQSLPHNSFNICAVPCLQASCVIAAQPSVLRSPQKNDSDPAAAVVLNRQQCVQRATPKRVRVVWIFAAGAPNGRVCSHVLVHERGLRGRQSRAVPLPLLMRESLPSLMRVREAIAPRTRLARTPAAQSHQRAVAGMPQRVPIAYRRPGLESRPICLSARPMCVGVSASVCE